MSQIHRADPALRKLTLYVGVILLAVLAAGAVIFQRWFANVQLLPPDEAWPQLLGTLTWIGSVMLLLVFAVSVYALRLGAKIKSTGQYPLQGARTIRDTEILEGKHARSRGTLLQAIGALLLVLAILLLVLCIRLAGMLSSVTA
jgi:hypothetical protein